LEQYVSANISNSIWWSWQDVACATARTHACIAPSLNACFSNKHTSLGFKVFGIKVKVHLNTFIFVPNVFGQRVMQQLRSWNDHKGSYHSVCMISRHKFSRAAELTHDTTLSWDAKITKSISMFLSYCLVW
jgi:hypothetical protein